MPNGLSNYPHYKQIIEGYEAFFLPISELLFAFSKNHNLMVEKYYHDAPCWSLRFSHPLGGNAQIELYRKSDSILSISGSWWVDDYDTFTRSIKRTEPIECEPVALSIEPHLMNTLRSVVSFTSGEWSQVATGYKGIWDKTWTKEQFEKLDNHWPIPKLD